MMPTLYKNTFGLDISDGAVRMVKLRKNGKKIVIDSYSEQSLPKGIIANGDIINEKKVISHIQKLIKNVTGKRLREKNVVAVLPETQTFIKLIQVPGNGNGELEESITQEIEKYVPLTIDELYFDWQLIKDGTTAEVLIGAASKKIIDSYLAMLEKCGLNVFALEIEAAPIIRSLNDNDAGAKILIDFGAARTGLIIVNNGVVELTISVPISGSSITKVIADTLQIDIAKAEQAKVVCGLDRSKCDGALLKILLSSITQLVTQVKKAMVFYKANFPDAAAITEIVLCGGGANFSELDQVLSERLGLPVKIGDPLRSIDHKSKLIMPKNKILSYTTAIGLALRSVQKEN